MASLNNGMSEEDQDGKTRKRSKKAKKLKDARRKQWTKVSLQRGNGAPYDPVECKSNNNFNPVNITITAIFFIVLGITSGEKALLSRFGITTIGQLAHLNILCICCYILFIYLYILLTLINYTCCRLCFKRGFGMLTLLTFEFKQMMWLTQTKDKFATIMDLQERAYDAVTAYVTKTSVQPVRILYLLLLRISCLTLVKDIVWGYLYLGDAEVSKILKKGYIDSDGICYYTCRSWYSGLIRCYSTLFRMVTDAFYGVP